MARPFVKPGESVDVSLLTSLETSRRKHIPLTWSRGTLSREPGPQPDVEVLKLKRADGSWRTFHVEKAAPRRIRSWETSEGEKAELRGSDRMKYWQMNQEGGEAALSRIGATPRNR